MKALLFLCCLVAAPSFADVWCAGVPNSVFAGTAGPGAAESSFYVTLPGSAETYYIGIATDDMAKARFALAMSAMLSGKTISMRFFSYATCGAARAANAAPTAMNVSAT